jgi:hypothetical protein
MHVHVQSKKKTLFIHPQGEKLKIGKAWKPWLQYELIDIQLIRTSRCQASLQLGVPSPIARAPCSVKRTDRVNQCPFPCLPTSYHASHFMFSWISHKAQILSFIMQNWSKKFSFKACYQTGILKMHVRITMASFAFCLRHYSDTT